MKCFTGECACEADFTGADCATNLSEKPVMYELATPTCDVRQALCLQVSVFGEGFAQTAQLKCVIETMEVINLYF